MATNTSYVRQLRNRLSLTSTQRAVLMGSLLGDGSLVGNMGTDVDTWNTNYRFQVVHSTEKEEYVLWKYRIFREWVLSPPRYQSVNNSLRFRTISHPEFTELRSMFYDSRGKKIIAPRIAQLISDPLSLAVWFMDDGAKLKRHGYTLNSQSFSLRDNLRLKRLLEEVFGLVVSLHRDKKYHRLYIRRISLQRFNELVIKFILPCMRYKLLPTP